VTAQDRSLLPSFGMQEREVKKYYAKFLLKLINIIKKIKHNGVIEMMGV
jgi:hypothetical protein